MMSDGTFWLLLIAAPTAVLFLLWIPLRSKPFARVAMSVIWCLTLVGLSVMGALDWEHDHEFTRFASACVCSASVWFTGPFLIFTVTKQWPLVVTLVGCILLPIASECICILLMAFTGQIWGM